MSEVDLHLGSFPLLRSSGRRPDLPSSVRALPVARCHRHPLPHFSGFVSLWHSVGNALGLGTKVARLLVSFLVTQPKGPSRLQCSSSSRAQPPSPVFLSSGSASWPGSGVHINRVQNRTMKSEITPRRLRLSETHCAFFQGEFLEPRLVILGHLGVDGCKSADTCCTDGAG